MSDTPSRSQRAYEALEKLPREVIGEVIDGELFVSPLPGWLQGRAALHLCAALAPFDAIPNKPARGSWVFLPKIELHFGEDVLVPDLAGWRRERMPEIPDVAHIDLAPDWVCEVLSPSTEKVDRVQKMAIYAREGVSHLWLMDPRTQTLEVYRREASTWMRLGEHAGQSTVHVEPFQALPLELGSLWER